MEASVWLGVILVMWSKRKEVEQFVLTAEEQTAGLQNETSSHNKSSDLLRTYECKAASAEADRHRDDLSERQNVLSLCLKRTTCDVTAQTQAQTGREKKTLESSTPGSL